LALARGPDSSIWVGTYGQGIFVLRANASAWEHIAHSNDSAAHSISWDFVHAFAFGSQGEVWYGTVGNGWGVSADGGKTWKNWEYRQLGPEWQYVAPNGIGTNGDTVYIATADGIKVTWDDGATWSVITDSAGAATTHDAVIGRIQNQYVLALNVGRGSNLWIGNLRGIAHSPDGGRMWHEGFAPPPCDTRGCVNRARAFLDDSRGRFWIGTEAGLFRFARQFDGWATRDTVPCRTGRECHGGAFAVLALAEAYAATSSGPMWLQDFGTHAVCGDIRADNGLTTAVTKHDSLARDSIQQPWRDLIVVGPRGLFNCFFGEDVFEADLRPALGTATGPSALRHTWFQRPIALADQPYIDQTYRFGSTMGGNFQPHQGVEFNNPDGTPVHAIGDGVVVYSGPAEAGANTVAIRHDRRLHGQYVFSAYYHNDRLLVAAGQRVKAGDVIALVGNTGRATNDHLHLEIHVAPTTDSSKIVDAAVRYPPFTTNPELWIEPLPGMGLVAGQVWDSRGQPVAQARIYGLVKPEPQETPFSYIETYGPRNHSDPVYREHFAIGDVPPGQYVFGVEIEGRKVFRRIDVKPGKVTWVEFRPEAGR